MLIPKHALKNIALAAISAVFIVELIKFLYSCIFSDKLDPTIGAITSAILAFIITAYIDER